MTIKTFWTIFIKMLGIWLVLDCFVVVPQFFSALYYYDTSQTEEGLWMSFLMLILTLGFYFLILRLFVFKTSWVIEKLQLDKGFEEEKIDLHIQLKTILSISTIVIGGLMLIDALPKLCTNLFAFYQQKNYYIEDPILRNVIFNTINTAIGYLLMTNSKKVVAFIHQKIEKNNFISD